MHKKVIALLELCRLNGITLNPEKFCISQKIELGGFEISSSQENPTPMIKPTKLSVNKLLEFKEPQDKKSVQRFLGLVNTFCHWSNKLNSNLPNIRSLVTKDLDLEQDSPARVPDNQEDGQRDGLPVSLQPQEDDLLAD